MRERERESDKFHFIKQSQCANVTATNVYTLRSYILHNIVCMCSIVSYIYTYITRTFSIFGSADLQIPLIYSLRVSAVEHIIVNYQNMCTLNPVRIFAHYHGHQ